MSEAARYRAAPFHSVKGRQGNRAVIQLLSGEQRIVSEAAFTVLDQMRAFRPLSEHVAIATNRLKARSGNTAGVAGAVEDLRRQGLLIDEETFTGLVRSDGKSSVTTIGIPARPDSKLLDRCIESYAANAREAGHEVRFIVAGPSERPVSGANVSWLDSKWTEQTIAALTKSGVDPALARFALTGSAEGLPAGVARTTGANRNALLLATKGEALLSVDDDTICSLIEPPLRRSGLSIQSAGTPLDMWFEPSLPQLKEARGVDLLAVAAGTLGRGLPMAATEQILPVDFDHGAMKKLCEGNAHVPVAQFGLSGDAATDGPVGWLMSIGGTRERLVANEAIYQETLCSRRVLMLPAGWGAADVAGLMSYCVALDNREMLPPFPPLGRDQDGVFIQWLRAIDPDSFTAYPPYAITHEPAEARAFDDDAIVRGARALLLNDMLRLTLEASRVDVGGSVADRCQRLGASQEWIASLPEAEFRELLLERRLDALSRAIAFAEHAMSVHGSKPVWWVRDLQKLVKAYEQGMSGPDLLKIRETGGGAPIEDELAVVQRYVGWCGRLLKAWPEITQAASRMSLARSD